jgi:hypothetical protein
MLFPFAHELARRAAARQQGRGVARSAAHTVFLDIMDDRAEE